MPLPANDSPDRSPLNSTWDALWNSVRRFLHSVVRHEHDAEDLTQQVCLELLERLKDEDPIRDPKRWLITAGKNRGVDHFRRQQRERKHERPIQDSDQFKAPVNDPAFREMLNKFMERLEPREREFLAWRLDDRTFDEIAEQIGVSKSTVKRDAQRIQMKWNECQK